MLGETPQTVTALAAAKENSTAAEQHRAKVFLSENRIRFFTGR
ncbi:MAG: hypothetical protein OSJ54_13390 [Oscillospiraceae bacterium]|nr:hypothetical protein [Oscillospiraceae bacterium]